VANDYDILISISRRNDGAGNLKIAAGQLGVSFIDIGQIDSAEIEDAWPKITVPFVPQDDDVMIELWTRRQQRYSQVLASLMASGILTP
jgi:hypothetical protein